MTEPSFLSSPPSPRADHASSARHAVQPSRLTRRSRLFTAVGLALGLALTASACAEPAGDAPAQVSVLTTVNTPYQGTVLDRPFERPRGVLTGTDGQPYDLYKNTKGRVTLLYFGYTNCPDVCPTTAADMAVAVRSLPEDKRDDVTVLFVSTDPERDTPQRMGEWLAAFDPSFVGLTGDIGQIKELAAGYGIPIEPPRQEPDGSITVDHGAQVIVFGADDQGGLVWTTNIGAQVMQHDLNLLVDGVPLTGGSGGQSAAPPGSRPTVTEPWIRIPMPGQPVTAAYFVVEGTGTADRLIAASSPLAGRVELHTNVHSGGSSKMVQVDGYDVPADGNLVLEPGGHHLMIFDLARELQPGDKVPFTLEFASGATLEIVAEARSYLPQGQGAGMGMGPGHGGEPMEGHTPGMGHANG